ncbi:hypothetical protein TPAR_01268 [Tolypocladium paradoxum]|uniref:Uncharacterized protein n=1 Tax=Tolypocladium paradoxum TaxID=94208 RepID=A0A2S4L7V7_9HYPO|nr:hypothetical protein TPAR_01268 [Tolypocladium paradoxum]
MARSEPLCACSSRQLACAQSEATVGRRRSTGRHRRVVTRSRSSEKGRTSSGNGSSSASTTRESASQTESIDRSWEAWMASIETPHHHALVSPLHPGASLAKGTRSPPGQTDQERGEGEERRRRDTKYSYELASAERSIIARPRVGPAGGPHE